MVRITIVGRISRDPVSYDEGSNTKAVKDDLINGIGKGILTRNGVGVLSDTLTGDYEFHLTEQGK